MQQQIHQRDVRGIIYSQYALICLVMQGRSCSESSTWAHRTGSNKYGALHPRITKPHRARDESLSEDLVQIHLIFSTFGSLCLNRLQNTADLCPGCETLHVSGNNLKIPLPTPPRTPELSQERSESNQSELNIKRGSQQKTDPEIQDTVPRYHLLQVIPPYPESL